MPLYQPKSETKFVKDKIMRSGADSLFEILSLIINLKSITGILHVNAVLIKIEQAKKLFVMDISEGTEVFIPKDLSQDQLPISFRYYDPLIQIIQERMTEDRKDFFKLQNTIKQEVYEQMDKTKKFLEKMGLSKGAKVDTNKLSFKYQAVNEQDKNRIKVEESIYTMSLQRSNYLQVDNELMRALHQNQHIVKAMTQGKSQDQSKKGRQLDPTKKLYDQVYIKYCQPDEVRIKRQAYVNFKAKFLYQLQNMRNQGQKQTSIKKTFEWINENYEQLYESQKDCPIGLMIPISGIRVNTQNSARSKVSLSSPTAISKNQKRNFNGLFKSTQGSDIKSPTNIRKSPRKKKSFSSFFGGDKEPQAKLKFKAQLYDTAERLIHRRRLRIQQKQLEELKEISHIRTNYEVKIKYLDENIERNLQYFVGQNTVNQDFMQLKGEIKEVEAQIRSNNLKKEKEEQIQNAKLLKNFRAKIKDKTINTRK